MSVFKPPSRTLIHAEKVLNQGEKSMTDIHRWNDWSTANSSARIQQIVAFSNCIENFDLVTDLLKQFQSVWETSWSIIAVAPRICM